MAIDSKQFFFLFCSIKPVLPQAALLGIRFLSNEINLRCSSLRNLFKVTLLRDRKRKKAQHPSRQESNPLSLVFFALEALCTKKIDHGFGSTFLLIWHNVDCRNPGKDKLLTILTITDPKCKR